MSKEKKTKSKKGKYCTFEGVVFKGVDGQKHPKKIACPECKRKMEASYQHCNCCQEGYGVYSLSFKKHRRKK